MYDRRTSVKQFLTMMEHTLEFGPSNASLNSFITWDDKSDLTCLTLLDESSSQKTINSPMPTVDMNKIIINQHS